MQTTSPQPALAFLVLDALAHRAWDQLDHLAAQEIAVAVRADPSIRTTRNQHVWRDVELTGKPALRDYLLSLGEAVPGLSLYPRSAARGDGHDVVRVDCAGVDSAGSPFDAEADFAVWEGHGRVLRIEAAINCLAIGEDVIRRAEGDPRKFFESFLG